MLLFLEFPLEFGDIVMIGRKKKKRVELGSVVERIYENRFGMLTM